ncbi:WXG100 family type VII secretion target [Actinophytocola sp.]|jgi:WXG100 family type VII secretion target|uniref:WXG100 family type VII secretion target n=1 Tax=Actinophytocola sp. TaxID=1872138 RepID=UPI002ED8A159
MPDGYSGEITQFTDAHKKVVSVKEDVEGTLKQVWDQVASLQGEWQGAAATAFTNMMDRFNNDATKLNQALEAIAEQLQAAGSTYHEQESSKQDIFGNLSAQLDG